MIVDVYSVMKARGYDVLPWETYKNRVYDTNKFTMLIVGEVITDNCVFMWYDDRSRVFAEQLSQGATVKSYMMPVFWRKT